MKDVECTVAAADWHSHWMPPTLVRLLERRLEPPLISRIGGVPHLQVGKRARPLDPVALDLDVRRAQLLRVGVRWQMLSLSSLWNIDNLPPAESLPLVRAFNDDTLQAVTHAPGMFAGLAALPLHDLEAASAELQRTRMNGLRGAILPAGAFATLSRARRLAPLLQRADALKAHLFIHPGHMQPRITPTPRDDNWWVRRIVLETQHQLSAAMLTLCSTALLRDYPHVSIQVANLGGGLPFYLERLRAVATDDPDKHAEPWCLQTRQLLVDSASFGPLAVGLAIDSLGPDKIVLGTDMPIFSAPGAVEALRTALVCRADHSFKPDVEAKRSCWSNSGVPGAGPPISP